MIDEVWTVGIDEVIAFVMDQPGAAQNAEGLYSCGDCVIELSEEEDHILGGMRLPRTRLKLSGDDSSVSAFHRLFILRFISAGG